MPDFSLILKGGACATVGETFHADIAVRDGVIAAIGHDLGSADRVIDCAGRLVLPGGVDSHCHLDQESDDGPQCADDFETGTRSAIHGGTTTVMPFAMQRAGQSLRDVVEAYRRRAEPRAYTDYGFHLILNDPNRAVLGQELPALVEDGITSFKVYMTYEGYRLNDYQMLDVLAATRRLGALTMIHAENDDMIRWLSDRLLEGGSRDVKYHAVAHARIAEGEATRRAIDLSGLLDTPVLIVHVSDEGAMRAIRDAQSAGLKVFGETCPQYLFLTAADLDRPGMEGAKFCCSPPPRDEAAQETLWRGLRNDTFQVFSSDHSPYRFDETGKLMHGHDAAFTQVANGIPGLELRLPLLFSEGVRAGRIDLQRFVQLTATNAARIYGMFPRKGTLSVGADADIAIWDPEKTVKVDWETMIHDDVGYTPYQGREVTGWPVTVIRRGEVAVDDGKLLADAGSGKFLACDRSDAAAPTGTLPSEMDPTRNFGADLL